MYTCDFSIHDCVLCWSSYSTFITQLYTEVLLVGRKEKHNIVILYYYNSVIKTHKKVSPIGPL